MSPDGRYIAFTSEASDLVPDDTNGLRDAFVLDRKTQRIERVNVGLNGVQANAYIIAFRTAISDDGRYVAFIAGGWTGSPDGAVDPPDVFVKDRQTGAVEMVNVSSTGVLAEPSISP